MLLGWNFAQAARVSKQKQWVTNTDHGSWNGGLTEGLTLLCIIQAGFTNGDTQMPAKPQSSLETKMRKCQEPPLIEEWQIVS